MAGTSAKVGGFIALCVLLSVSGPLCAGMGGKKKKKMMYLTTKNAGNLNFPHKLEHHRLFPLFIAY